MEDEEVLMSQSPFPHLSGSSRFYKEGEGKRTKRSKEGVEVFYTQMNPVHSDKASDVLVYIILV